MMLTKKLVILGISGLMTGLVTFGGPSPARAAESPESPQVVKITASKFHFTPDHIVLAKGQPVTLQLTSADRTHGSWSGRLVSTRTSSRARRPR